jgi:membrane associated rhomboid family serine protease
MVDDTGPETGEVAGAGRLRWAFRVMLAVVGGLWLIWLVGALSGWHLVSLGVFPRSLPGVLGIVTAPLIHVAWSHLFANTLPLLILGTALLYGYPRAAARALPLIYLGSGFGVWLFARASYHIGASGVTHGMMFFVFTMGVLRRDRRAIGLALIVFLLYGGMVASILPQAPEISFESHLFGALMGVIAAFWLRDRDPPPPEKRYSWELEGEGEDSETGDQRPWEGR